MKVSQLYHWAGIAGIAAGFLNIIAEFAPDRLGGPLNLLVVILGLWLLTALYIRQREESGMLGFIGYIINTFGLALFAGLVFAQLFVLSVLDTALVTELLAGPTGQAALVSMVIFTVGVILFGVALIRANLFPKWAAALYIIGFLPVAVAPFIREIIVSIGEVVAGIGLMWLSYALMSSVGQGE